MIGRLARLWKRLPKRLLAFALVVALVVFILLNWRKILGSGIPFLSGRPSVPASKESTAATAPIQSKNVVTIRGELFVFNGQEKTLEEMEEVLARLKVERPEAEVVLETTGQDNVGMVYRFEKLVERNRISRFERVRK